LLIGGKVLNFKKIFKYAVIIIIILALACYGYNYYLEGLDDSEPQLMKLSDRQLSTTIVAPTLDIKIEKAKNIVFCSTFQIAWNQICKNIIKGTIEVDNAPEYVSKLNLLINSAPEISEDSYVAVAGFAEDNILKKTCELLNQKNFSSEILNNITLNPFDIFAFSYLYKDLPFEEVFEKINGHIFEHDGQKSKVKAFGINVDNKRLRKQVDIVYINDNDHNQFVISLKTKSDTDELVISTVLPEETLEKTYLKIRKYVEEKNSFFLDRKIYLAIPKVDFNINYHYNNLENKKILNKNFEEYFINVAYQAIRFKMNEKGAVLKSEVNIGARAQGKTPSFIINGPFIIYLRDKNSAFPYFIAYIANDELLIKSNFFAF